MTGRCNFDNGGWLRGPISIQHHLTGNRNPGSLPRSAAMGVIMHTMVGNLPGTDSVFRQRSFGASAHFGIDQKGHVIQWVPLGDGAWHIMNGNSNWYGIEHADNGNPHNPLTVAQMNASAQVVEALATAAHFPLQSTNSVHGEGYGVHNMGGAAWGGHSCPDYPFAGNPFARSGQRGHILDVCRAIRGGHPVPKPPPTPAPKPGHPVLSRGDTGAAVKVLQTDLNRSGSARPALLVDGDFGAKTFDAVKQFQKTHKLAIDGVVGPMTWSALEHVKLGPRK